MTQRTGQQNRSIHLFCEHVAKALNESGQSVQLTLAQAVEVDWTEKAVKELLFRPIMRATLGIESTTELNKTGDIDVVFDTLNRFLSEKFGLHVPFPSHEIGYWETVPLKHDTRITE